MQIAHSRCLNTKPDQRAFGNNCLIGLIWHAGGPFRLIEKIGKLGAGTLEACRIDIGDVVGNHFQIELLGVHTGCGNRQGFHSRSLFSESTQTGIRLISR